MQPNSVAPHKVSCYRYPMQLDRRDLARIEILVRRHKSQDKAAALIGISERTLGRYRRGLSAPMSHVAMDGFRAALSRALANK